MLISQWAQPSEVEWLSRLDGIQPTPSRRLVGFLDSCSDIDVSWSLNKVLLARMKVEGSTIEFMAGRTQR